MPELESKFTILKPTNSETIELKETQSFVSKDGSLLMKWHEVDTAPSAQGHDKALDYATAVMPGYSNVKNLPAEEAWQIFNYKNTGRAGAKKMDAHINKSSPTMLLPLQAGVCPFECKGCPFAFSAPETQGKKTKQIGVEETRILITQSLKQAEKNNIEISNIGISFVGSGDATPNPFLEKIFEMIAAEFPNVARVRFSTVAGKVAGEHQTPMQVVAKIIGSPNYTGRPMVSMQVSAHSTDEKQRAAHVYHQKLTKPPSAEEAQKGIKLFTLEHAINRMLPLEEVAKQFKKIVEAQKQKNLKPIRKPSLTFVCTNETEINAKNLKEFGFDPETTVIQLRPILSENKNDCMNEEKFSDIYHWLREVGYDVVIMPVSPSGVELIAA